jgi:hypothetical protein
MAGTARQANGFKFAAVGKITIMDEGKVVGFQIKETAEDT